MVEPSLVSVGGTEIRRTRNRCGSGAGIYLGLAGVQPWMSGFPLRLCGSPEFLKPECQPVSVIARPEWGLQ